MQSALAALVAGRAVLAAVSSSKGADVRFLGLARRGHPLLQNDDGGGGGRNGNKGSMQPSARPHALRKVIPVWLGCLPTKDDKIEAKVVHEQLCSGAERETDIITLKVSTPGSIQFVGMTVSQFSGQISNSSGDDT